jgi:hypothetical protein
MQAGIGSTSCAREIATVIGNMICAQAFAVMMLEISVAIVAMIRYKENPLTSEFASAAPMLSASPQ